MVRSMMFVVRFVVGIAILLITWFVLDMIHDRNTEIVVSMIGLLYTFIFVVSRRLQYFGLTVFSFFGRTASYIQKVPYDDVMRDEIGLPTDGRYAFLNIVFAALIEMLCLFRLFSSLVGRGWDTLFEPLRTVLHFANF
jgi:hypothetical protein